MKSYVADKYPDIRNPYLAGGIGRFYTFDNSLQAHGDSILQITSDLDVPYDFTPPRCPWVKGEVEGAFAVANQTFFQEMPGYVLSPDLKFDKHDYDPAANAVIGLRHLLWLWHHWLLDVYHANAPRNGMMMSPNDRWLEGTRRVKPTFIERGTDLDFLFGIVREGRRLDNRGVVYEGLYYYSDGIDILRSRRGAKLLVKVKVKPTQPIQGPRLGSGRGTLDSRLRPGPGLYGGPRPPSTYPPATALGAAFRTRRP